MDTTPNTGITGIIDDIDIDNMNFMMHTPTDKVISSNTDGSLDDLIILRKGHLANPLIAYLNINSLRGTKFQLLHDILTEIPMDIICIDETKLTCDFPNSQFYIEGYQHPPYRRDRNDKLSSRGGGKMFFIKNGIITKRIKSYDTPHAETICLELNISGRKWFIMFGYRPESINRELFVHEVYITLCKAVNNYDFIIFAGDLNVDLDIPNSDTKGFLSDLCDTFDLTNLIGKTTCTKSSAGSSLDVFLTNHPRCFQHTCVVETGLSDHHKLIGSFLRSKFKKLPPKNIHYRNYKHFNETVFLEELAAIDFNRLFQSNNADNYDILTDNVRALIDKHAPLKSMKVRGNNKPFVTKELRSAIMKRSRLRTRYNKWKSRENYVLYRLSKKECDRLTEAAKTQYFRNATENGTMTNKEFWKVMKPALTNKGIICSDVIILEEDGQLISDESKLVEIFNKHYINIVETTMGAPPTTLGNPYDSNQDEITVREIIDKFADHPIIMKIRENKLALGLGSFTLPTATREEVNKIMSKLDTTKACGPDKIPPKIVKISANILDSPIANIITANINSNRFSENAKNANVPPVYKKDSRSNKLNYRPVSLLNVFSKILERWTKEKSNHLLMIFCLNLFLPIERDIVQTMF